MANPGSTADENEIPTLAAGTVLGKYSIVKLLGSGGMGAVYEATHTEIGKRVAIKVLSPMISAVPGARARFLREAQLTSRVRHPHIVDVADMGSDGGHTYLVMEFLHGEDLAQRIERLGPVGVEELADIMLPVCSAVAAAHAAGITHRDLKPQNIFLAAGTRRVLPKVLDFGISKGNDAVTQAGTLTGTGAMIGTPYYLAPEQIMDSKSAGSASDQYALGIILYECLTGKRPYDGENLFIVFQGIVGGTPKRPREYRPDIPPEMEEVVLRAMKSDPKQRFPTIEDFGRALLPFASGRARVIWEEAFSSGAAGDLPPGRPSIAMFPTPTPPPRAATLMPPGLSNPGRIPGSSTPAAPGAVTLSTSQRIGGGTPTPPPKTIAWQSPMPQPRVAPGGTAAMPSPETEAAATVRASMAMSKSHPVVLDNGLDFEPAHEPARSKKGLVIGVVAAVAAAGIGFFVVSGGSKEPAVTPAPVAAPVAAPRAVAPVEAAKPLEAPAPPPPAAVKPVAPPEVKPAAPPAELPEATASTRHDSKGKGKSKSHREAKSSPAGKPAAAKPAAGKPAAAGVPVID